MVTYINLTINVLRIKLSIYNYNSTILYELEINIISSSYKTNYRNCVV